MDKISITKCPYCGGEELIETRVCSYGGAYLAPLNRAFGSTALYATVCRDCASVVRTYCANPEKLLPKKDRRK